MEGVVSLLPSHRRGEGFSEVLLYHPCGEITFGCSLSVGEPKATDHQSTVDEPSLLVTTDDDAPVSPPTIGGAVRRGGASVILDTCKQLHISRYTIDTVMNPYDSTDRNLIYMAMLDGGHVSVGERYHACGKTLGSMVCENGHRTSIPMSCGLVFCPTCRSRRMGKLYHKLEPVFRQMKRPQLLTLTVPNVFDLRGGYVALGEAFSRLRRSRCMQFVKGGVYTRETTLTANAWNIHIHCLYDGYINYDAVRNRWNELTGAVWIQNTERVNKKSILEVIGYCGKVPQFPSEHDYVEYFESVSGMRLTQNFGSCFAFVYVNFYTFECPECGSVDCHFEGIFQCGGDGFDPP